MGTNYESAITTVSRINPHSKDNTVKLTTLIYRSSKTATQKILHFEYCCERLKEFFFLVAKEE